MLLQQKMVRQPLADRTFETQIPNLLNYQSKVAMKVKKLLFEELTIVSFFFL